jgi:hypothetical protein
MEKRVKLETSFVVRHELTGNSLLFTSQGYVGVSRHGIVFVLLLRSTAICYVCRSNGEHAGLADVTEVR